MRGMQFGQGREIDGGLKFCLAENKRIPQPAAKMIPVLYKGPACSLSRFGEVRPGSKFRMTESEWATVCDNPNFQSLAEEKFRRAEFIAPLPGPTPHFDLRLVDWSNPRLTYKLDHLKKSKLVNIGRAMKFLGLPVDVATRFQKQDIVDSIVQEARDVGWLEFQSVIINDEEELADETAVPELKTVTGQGEKTQVPRMEGDGGDKTPEPGAPEGASKPDDGKDGETPGAATSPDSGAPGANTALPKTPAIDSPKLPIVLSPSAVTSTARPGPVVTRGRPPLSQDEKDKRKAAGAGKAAERAAKKTDAGAGEETKQKQQPEQ